MDPQSQPRRAATWGAAIGQAAVGIWMAGVICAAFGWAKAAKGFNGESSRILFFHVPQAMLAFLAFLLSTGYGLAYLRTRRPRHDAAAAAAAGIGLLFCVLTTVTGSIFARVSWGTYWNWDPRETTIVMVLFIYGAYFALRSAIDDPERRAALAGAYGLFAFATVPFLFFVLPRMTTSLHPSDTLAPGGTGMDPQTRGVFLASVAGHLALFVWMLRLRLRLVDLEGAEEEARDGQC